MGKDSLDKHFKDQLYNHKTPTDPELIWKNIQLAKGGNSSGKSFLYWLIPLLFVVISVAGYSMFSDSANDLSEKDPNLNANKISSQTDFPQNDKDAFLNSSSEQEIKKDEKGFQNRVDSIQNIETLHVNNAGGANGVYNSKEGINIIDKIKTTNYNSNYNDGTIDPNLDQPLKKEEIVFESITENAGLNQTKDNNTIIEENESSSYQNQSTEELNSSDISTQSLPNLKFEELSLIKGITPYLLFSQLYVPQITLASNAFKPYRHNNDWEFSLGAHGIYGLTDKQLSTSDTEASSYLSERNKTESSLEAVGLGFDIKASKWNNFYLKAGLSYNQINERFDLMDSYDSTYIDNNAVIRIIVNSNGDSISETGPALVTETFFFQKRIHNYYRFIDFPVSVGFEYQTGALGYFIEAGASMNILFSQKGEIMDPELLPYDLKDDTQSFFKSNAGLSLIAGFGLSYRLNDFFSVAAQTNMRYQLSSFTTSNNPINQKYIVVGLQAGLRFHLGQ